MEKDMLGKVVRKLVDLPDQMLVVIFELIKRLCGEDCLAWFMELKRFIRKEKCWLEFYSKSIIECISLGESLIIDSVDGKENIPDSKDVFSFIDPDFDRRGLNIVSEPTEETPVDVYVLKQKGGITLTGLFLLFLCDLCKLYFTQNQVINFVRKYPKWLLEAGDYTAYFLMGINGTLFVADVKAYDSYTHIYLRKFSYEWYLGERRPYIIVPKMNSRN